MRITDITFAITAATMLTVKFRVANRRRMISTAKNVPAIGESRRCSAR